MTLVRICGVGDVPQGEVRRFELDHRPFAVTNLGEDGFRVVDAICYRPFPELGNRSLAQVQRFGPKEQGMVEEAAHRLGTGRDPGIVPERFLIGAVRFAVDNRLDTPGQLATYFYKELARR